MPILRNIMIELLRPQFQLIWKRPEILRAFFAFNGKKPNQLRKQSWTAAAVSLTSIGAILALPSTLQITA